MHGIYRRTVITKNERRSAGGTKRIPLQSVFAGWSLRKKRMNNVTLSGRLTRDPEIRYSNGENSIAIARYTLAVDRRRKRAGEESADFIRCVCFGKSAEFAEKYMRQGMKMIVYGRIQTGSYVNREGNKVYTTEVVVENQEFAESKAAYEARSQGQNQNYSQGQNYQQNQNYQQPPNYQQNGGYQQAPVNPAPGYTPASYGAGASGPGMAPVASNYPQPDEGFMNIPEGIEEELPFN